jgi:hypothetical protein
MFFPAHEENQSLHLPLKDAAVPIDIILLLYTGRQARFCPLGVYQLPDRRKAIERHLPVRLRIVMRRPRHDSPNTFYFTPTKNNPA